MSISITHNNFSEVVDHAQEQILGEGELVNNLSWQAKKDSESKFSTWEILNFNFSCLVPSSIKELQLDIQPNLPWAEDHFQERVGGEPLNPGEQYKNWPYYKKDEFRTEGEQFTHTYMERFWAPAKPGIRYAWGNLRDVAVLLQRDPFTRQAYLPVWFPEDTGASHGGRVPCTLGYHFLLRDNMLHMWYDIRSCDLLRHFQDDIYLACRLLIWMLAILAVSEDGSTSWAGVVPGWLTMNAHSLHIFEADKPTLKYRIEKGIL